MRSRFVDFCHRGSKKQPQKIHSAGKLRTDQGVRQGWIDKDLLEYAVVHEIEHLLLPNHDERFVVIMDRHWPQWRESGEELNALQLS